MQDAEGEPDPVQALPGEMSGGGEDTDLGTEPPKGNFETWGVNGDASEPPMMMAPQETSANPSPQAGTGELPMEAQSEGGCPPEGGKGPWKGGRGGKGRNWNSDWNWKERQPSGPNLPRQRVSATPIAGEVVEWRGKYGWIQPSERFEHPKAQMRNGRIFVSKTDLAFGQELRPGTMCHFYVFEDEAGLGAEECVPADQPEGVAARPRVPPAPTMGQGRQGGFRPPGPPAGQPGGQWSGGKGGPGKGFQAGGKGEWSGGKGGPGKGGCPPGGKGGQWGDVRPNKGGGKGPGGGGGGGGKAGGKMQGGDGQKGGRGKGKGGGGKGGGGGRGGEFSLPGYVNLKQQNKGGGLRDVPMQMGNPHDEGDFGAALQQPGMRGLQLGPRDMHGGKSSREGCGKGRGAAAEPGWNGPAAEELPEAVGLANYADFGGGFMGSPMPGGMPLGGPGGLQLGLGQSLPGALPGTSLGPPPPSHLPLPGGQGLGWPMQPGLPMGPMGAQPGRGGLMPTGNAPLPGGSDPGWSMQPGLGMDPQARRMG